VGLRAFLRTWKVEVVLTRTAEITSQMTIVEVQDGLYLTFEGEFGTAMDSDEQTDVNHPRNCTFAWRQCNFGIVHPYLQVARTEVTNIWFED